MSDHRCPQCGRPCNELRTRYGSAISDCCGAVIWEYCRGCDGLGVVDWGWLEMLCPDCYGTGRRVFAPDAPNPARMEKL